MWPQVEESVAVMRHLPEDDLRQVLYLAYALRRAQKGKKFIHSELQAKNAQYYEEKLDKLLAKIGSEAILQHERNLP